MFQIAYYHRISSNHLKWQYHHRTAPIRFGYTIVYVTDVKASIQFFEVVFGLAPRFYHDSGYGEMETGQTVLAFASHVLGRSPLL